MFGQLTEPTLENTPNTSAHTAACPRQFKHKMVKKKWVKTTDPYVFHFCIASVIRTDFDFIGVSGSAEVA